MKNLLLLMLGALTCFFVNGQCGSQSYVEPQFTIAVQNPACPLVGEITVASVSDGIPPYLYTLLPNNISNSNGTFSNLSAGTYFVQLKDACGTIRTRQATITGYSFNSSSTVTTLGCSKFEFQISTPYAGPKQYGIVINGSTDTTWSNNDQVVYDIQLPSSVSLIVKDECGNISVSHQSISKESGGYIKTLNERIKCNGQEIYPEYYGFTSPTVCLYKYPQRTLVECKQAPAGTYNGGASTNFLDLPFGQDYYVIVQDGCYRDSAFFKDKTSFGGSELNPFAWRCNTFDIHADGNGYDTVCLWNATTNTLVSCKPWTDTSINPNSGKPWPYGGAEWYDLPYGKYYAFIFDPCLDTLLRIDTTVSYPFKSSASLHPSCKVMESSIAVNYNFEAPGPWTTYVYWPNDSLVATFASSGTNWSHHYPTSPEPGKIKVITQDGCGNRDTSLVNQEPLHAVRRIEIKGGCPGPDGSSGNGDLLLHGNSAYAAGGTIATIKIIEKDGQPVSIPHTYTEANGSEQDFYFTNLSTGNYVLESLIGCGGYKAYDTVQVKPYVYPLQDQTHITQCGSNSYAFKDTVTGGVAAFTYEILTTAPMMQSLLTGPQSSNTFIIPPGSNLDTISIRILDACGNSNIKAFPVNKLATCTPLIVGDNVTSPSIQNKLIKIYPNPSTRNFTIAFSQKKKTDYQIEMINAVGVNVFSKILKNIDVENSVINKDFVPGAYIINITDLKANKKETFKQIIL